MLRKSHIINHLTDQDFYSYTMAQTILHQLPSIHVKYKFKCRNYPTGIPAHIPDRIFIDLISSEIQHLCTLRHTQEELSFLSKIPYIKSDFIEFLRILQLNPDFVKVYLDSDGKLNIDIEGPWLLTIWFEQPILAIVTELFCLYSVKDEEDYTLLIENGKHILEKNLKLLKDFSMMSDGFKCAEFGTRRRFSRFWQHYLLERIYDEDLYSPTNGPIVGTSNVYFSMLFNWAPKGTVAHQFFEAFQQLVSIKDSQRAALEMWAKEYQGELGIVLTDTLTTDIFLKDFHKGHAKTFDGARGDSGNLAIWGEKLIRHYESLGIDPKTKTAIFSDKLSFQTAFDLYERFHERIKVSFGIGTFLTNNMGFEAPQNVIKMVECNGGPVAKISDDPEKAICDDPDYLKYVKNVLKIGG